MVGVICQQKSTGQPGVSPALSLLTSPRQARLDQILKVAFNINHKIRRKKGGLL